MAGDDKVEIDEQLYSRQLYVLGHDAQRRMGSAKVLISGAGGVGIEIAKNVILAGVQEVTIHDQQNACVQDISAQYFLNLDDVGKNRAECCLSHLKPLNEYVQVDSFTGPLTRDQILKYDVIVLTDVAKSHQGFDETLRISDICRDNGKKLIIAETLGVVGRVFCDFGEKFIVYDRDGENPYQYHIRKIIKGKETEIIMEDDVRHFFDTGDMVKFSEVQGMTEINQLPPQQVTVTGPYSIKIGNTSSFGDYKNGGLVTFVKTPFEMNFKSLRESLGNPEFEMRLFDEKRIRQLHLAFSVLSEYVEKKKSLPEPWSQADAQHFVEMARHQNDSASNPLESIDEDLLRKFAYTAFGNLGPIQGIIGGIAAQEVTKAISGKFTPINQWLYFEAFECLPDGDVDQLQELCKPRGCQYDGQIAVFGEKTQEKLAKSKLFLVGAGAIGCEMLKNWAMMGIATDAEGLVTVTDMDSIEKSNLNRQFLFRSGDVGKLKSETAAAAVRRMNAAMNIVAHESRVGPETENVYNDDFYQGLTAVVNALDNVDARKYVDQRCVYNGKPMFDSGTLGARCSLQDVLPHLTQAYSDTKDAPEKSYPMCTLKHFPVAIEHTLQWARDEFEGPFKQSVETANKYFSQPDFVENIRKESGFRPLEVLRELKCVLIEMSPKSFEDCVTWARKKFQENYTNQIRQLLHVYPPDHVGKTGAPFWSGPKRCPKPLEFSVNNETHLDYVVAAANLVAHIFGIPPVRDRTKIASMATGVKVEEFHPTKIFIPASDEEAKAASEAAPQGLDSDAVEEMERIIKSLPERKDFVSALHPHDFEKDDDSNFHMDFIVAASNLRAENYGITPADRHKSKLIAGKIIPAISTTTSVVVGLVCIELYKWIQGIRKINLFQNGYINLATNSFFFTRPTAAGKRKYRDTEFTVWDFFDVNEEITLQKLIELFKEKHTLDIDTVSYGPSVLYNTYLTANPQQRLAMLVSKAIEEVTKKPVPANAKSVLLKLGCPDENDEDMEVPAVRYRLHQPDVLYQRHSHI